MKLEVRFRARELGPNRRFEVISMLKDIFKDAGMYSQLYEYRKEDGTLVTSKQQKPFGFAIVPYNISLRKWGTTPPVKQKTYSPSPDEPGKLILRNGIFTIIFSSHDYNILKTIANGIDSHSEYIKQQYGWELLESPAEPYNEPEVTEDNVKLKLISPLYVKDKDGKDVSLLKEPEKFNRELNYIMNSASKILRGYELKAPLVVEPVKGTRERRVLLYRDNEGKKYKGLAVHGKIRLKGVPEDINFAIDVCLGFRRSQGFGLVYPVPQLKNRKGKRTVKPRR